MIIKIIIFLGELTDNSAKKEALPADIATELRRHGGFPACFVRVPVGYGAFSSERSGWRFKALFIVMLCRSGRFRVRGT